MGGIISLSGWVGAQEVQQHGLVFERWACEVFFDGFEPENYTGKWDIPGEVNTRFGGVPVNPKATRFGAPVGMGDALRQFDVDEAFILLLGFWRQEGEHKRFVKLVAPRVEPEGWRRLWGPVTREDLERLDAVIKDRETDYREVRRRALAMKNAPPFSEAVMVLNPKIDARGQRRLQCSLRYADVFRHLLPGVEPGVEEEPSLWGERSPGLIFSPPRTFGPRAGEDEGEETGG